MQTHKLPHIASEPWNDVWHDLQVTGAYQCTEGRHRATAASNQARTSEAAGKVARPLDNGPEIGVTRAVVWQTSKKKYQVYNWYQPPSDKRVTLALGDTKQRFVRTVIAGDANAHHQAFGYDNSDQVGQWIVDLTNSSNLTSLVTEKSEPTFLHSKGGLHRPDVALVSSDLIETVRREVLEDVGSDHRPSLITIGCAPTNGRDSTAKWNFGKAIFREALDKELTVRKLDTIPIEAANDNFARAIVRAARRAIPRGVVKRYTLAWTEELKQAIKRRQMARRAYAITPTVQNRKRYNALCRRAKKMGQIARTKEWHKTCAELDTNSKPRITWQLVRKLEGKGLTTRVTPPRTQRKSNGIRPKRGGDPQHYFAKVSRTPRNTGEAIKMRRERKTEERKPTASNKAFEAPFSGIELEDALRKGKKGKAPGKDGVTQEMLVEIRPEGKRVLLELLNRTWNSGVLPKDWRTAVLVPILKKGKCSKSVSSYRPISLTSVISKTMERMVNSRLYYHMENNICLDEAQAGFWKDCTTVDQLVHFTQSVINAWQTRDHTVAVFVNLKQAYDKVWRAGLYAKLQRYGVTGKMYRWIKSFLGERYIRTRVRGTLSRASPTRDGLLQDSALSCTLFLCYINDISDGLPAESKLAYANDIVIWQHDTDVDRATEAINRDLVALKRYCDRWKLQINTVKTVYSVFSNSNQDHPCLYSLRAKIGVSDPGKIPPTCSSIQPVSPRGLNFKLLHTHTPNIQL
ncbi:RNA-directed DNA polymerase from transposon x-element [Plakobranchus ocellatus]|uniref:RNA-directed DNA polymerase from transposon x-element n=1 Tax=Plakobranchus ocellatus TaxID=259542 RepID=A0AAV4AB40_9GAST|nr:RNA-directed DNA polymerase from transposon x-element [Plakobranchus ocellatus]